MEQMDWTPGKILETASYYWRTCTLHAAVKLDIFTRLGDQWETPGRLASILQVNERALDMLLNALTAMNLLNKQGDAFGNTPASKNFLSQKSEKYIGNIIMHHHHLIDSWSQLDMAVKTGSPTRSRISFSDDETREHFLMGMFNMAMNLAPTLTGKIDLSGRRHLLDLGGGPGTYAIHFCMKNPELKATIYDLPTTEPFAQKTVARFNLSHRIDFCKGNYVEDDIPGRYDAAWLSQILHGEGPEDCRMLIRKTVAAMEPGGIIGIHEFILNNTADGPLFPALFSLNMLLGTDKGQAYTEKEICDMLSEAGVKNIRRIPIQTPNDSGVIVGTV